jgi:hypothetical protein
MVAIDKQETNLNAVFEIPGADYRNIHEPDYGTQIETILDNQSVDGYPPGFYPPGDYEVADAGNMAWLAPIGEGNEGLTLNPSSPGGRYPAGRGPYPGGTWINFGNVGLSPSSGAIEQGADAVFGQTYGPSSSPLDSAAASFNMMIALQGLGCGGGPPPNVVYP